MLALPFDWESLAHHVHVVDPTLDAAERAALTRTLRDLDPGAVRATVVPTEGDDPDTYLWKGLGAAVERGRRAGGFPWRRTEKRRRFLAALEPDTVTIRGTPRDPSWARAAAQVAARPHHVPLPDRPPRDGDGIAFVLKSDLGRPTAHVAQALQTVSGLAAAGHRVTLVSPLESSSLTEALDRCGVPDDPATRARISHRAIEPIRRRPESARAVVAALQALADDGVGRLYFRQARIASMLLPAARRLGFRTFMEAHQPYVTWSLGERRRLGAFRAASAGAGGGALVLARGDRAYERRVYEALDGVVCTTRAMRRRVRRLAPGTSTLLLRNGAPEGASTERPAAAPADVLYAGRTDPVKGTDVLIEALAQLDGVTATIVGGPTDDDLAPHRARAAELGITDRVAFHGWEPQPALFARVRAARVVVHPLPGRGSREWRIFTCPLKLLEAMALGTPVVATDLPAVREVVRDGVTGVLVAPGDAAALADGIRRVLADPTCADRLRTAAKRRVARWTRSKRTARLAAFLAPTAEAAQNDGTAGADDA